MKITIKVSYLILQYYDLCVCEYEFFFYKLFRCKPQIQNNDQNRKLI